MNEEKWLRRFVLNEHLDVVLDGDGRTLILLDGEEYDMCKRLVLNIPLDDAPAYKDVKSIDDAAQRHATLYKGRGYEPGTQDVLITPEEEFQGHCSNLQAWVEHDYDTRLLHSNLSFNLLRGLAEAGDEKAARVLETEIVDRARNASRTTAMAILFTFADKSLSPEVFHAFAENPDPQVRILIANDAINPKLPADVLTRLAGDENVFVRRAIANRIDIPDDALARLFQDDDALVQISISKYAERVKEVEIAYRGTILAMVPSFAVRLDLSRKGIESIAEIEGLDKLVNLKTLILADNKITKINGFDSKNLTTLQSLSLSHNRITKIKDLDDLVNLTELAISKNQLSKIEGLDNLVELRSLNLYGNQIARMEGLNHLSHLFSLLLYENKISRIEGIDSLLNLSNLNLSDNCITRIEGLDFHGPNIYPFRPTFDPYLQFLDLSGNQIVKIEGLDALIYLLRLNLSKNRIEVIERLENLKNLHFVNLSGNCEGLAPDGWYAWPQRDGVNPDD